MVLRRQIVITVHSFIVFCPLSTFKSFILWNFCLIAVLPVGKSDATLTLSANVIFVIFVIFAYNGCSSLEKPHSGICFS